MCESSNGEDESETEGPPWLSHITVVESFMKYGQLFQRFHHTCTNFVHSSWLHSTEELVEWLVRRKEKHNLSVTELDQLKFLVHDLSPIRPHDIFIHETFQQSRLDIVQCGVEDHTKSRWI